MNEHERIFNEIQAERDSIPDKLWERFENEYRKYILVSCATMIDSMPEIKTRQDFIYQVLALGTTLFTFGYQQGQKDEAAKKLLNQMED